MTAGDLRSDRAPVGDAPPPAVAQLFEASSAGRFEDAAASFATDGMYAYWDGTGDERAPRTVIQGRDAIAGVLEGGRGRAPQLLACVHDGKDCLFEARLVDSASGEAQATVVADLQLDRDGAIARCLSFRCPVVEASPTWDDQQAAAPGSAREVLDRYFEHLHAARFEEAVACFTEDCLYSHPPYVPGTPRAEFRGHAELLAGFQKRGPAKWSHELVACIQRGTECFIEGLVPDVPGGGSFVSAVSLGHDGRIQRYLATYTSPLVPRR